MQNFRLLTAQVKLHQIHTLTGSFCWKYIKFQLKKYRGVMSHDTEKWCKIWRKTNLFFQKWQEFGEFWSKHSTVPNICSLTGSLRAKYITYDLKKYGGVIFGVQPQCSCANLMFCSLKFKKDVVILKMLLWILCFWFWSYAPSKLLSYFHCG